MTEHRIPCEVIQDLLPLYLDHLTSVITETEIEEHLKECEACKRRYERISITIESEAEEKQLENQREIDYLKRIKKSANRKVWGGILAAGIVLISIAAVKLFVIGSPAKEYYVTYIDVDENQLHVGGAFYGSGAVFSRYKVEKNKDGTSELIVYACLPFGSNRKDTFNLSIDISEIGTEMDINGMTVQSGGRIIGTLANDLYQARHPYVGDMSSNGKITEILGISRTLGNYKNELQTTQEPYGWTLYFEENVKNPAVLEERMRQYSCVLIALIDNLEEVSWNYFTESERGTVEKTTTMTTDACSDYTGDFIKSFAESPEKIQELLELLEIE